MSFSHSLKLRVCSHLDCLDLCLLHQMLNQNVMHFNLGGREVWRSHQALLNPTLMMVLEMDGTTPKIASVVVVPRGIAPWLAPKHVMANLLWRLRPPLHHPPQLRSHRQQWFHPKWKNQLASMTMECTGSYLVVVWYGLNLIVFCYAGLSYFG